MSPLRRAGSRVKLTLRRMLSRRVPARLARNFLPLAPPGRQELLTSIKAHYLTGWRSTENYAPSYTEYLVADHLHTGLDGDRSTVIPWLDRVRRLDGLRVLDIGCGTGSSTVALAEQGAGDGDRHRCRSVASCARSLPDLRPRSQPFADERE